MADEDRTRRFARLRPPPAPAQKSGDLFAHFGVAVAPPPTPADDSVSAHEPTPVLGCSDCGWLRPTPLVESCPICGNEPRPAETTDDDAPDA